MCSELSLILIFRPSLLGPQYIPGYSLQSKFRSILFNYTSISSRSITLTISNNQGGPRFLLLEPLSEYMTRLHAPAMATCGLWKNRILGEKSGRSAVAVFFTIVVAGCSECTNLTIQVDAEDVREVRVQRVRGTRTAQFSDVLKGMKCY